MTGRNAIYIKTMLSDRMKRYEEAQYHKLVPRMPAIIRIDGRAFHSWTKDCQYPFDPVLRGWILYAAQKTAADMQGFRLAYHQSDEVSFLLVDYDKHETQAWFDGCVQKICSISASLFTAHFNLRLRQDKIWKLAQFDARVFNIPIEDVSNYFVWRAKDWERNSLSMYCSSFFSQKELHGKVREEQHEMLHEIGKNWTTDVPIFFRNGTFIPCHGNQCHLMPTFEDIDKIVKPLLKESV